MFNRSIGAGTAIPLLILKKGEIEENDGEMLEMLLNAEEPIGCPAETVLVRDVPCRTRRCLLITVEEKLSKPGRGPNWLGSRARLAVQYCNFSCASWLSASAYNSIRCLWHIGTVLIDDIPVAELATRSCTVFDTPASLTRAPAPLLSLAARILVLQCCDHCLIAPSPSLIL